MAYLDREPMGWTLTRYAPVTRPGGISRYFTVQVIYMRLTREIDYDLGQSEARLARGGTCAFHSARLSPPPSACLYVRHAILAVKLG